MFNLDFSQSAPPRTRAIFHDLQPSRDDFHAAVIEGLNADQKSLPCRFLYDAAGSALFDRICDLPEYYPTRTEIGILRDNAGAIAAAIGPDAQVVELGSGSSTKIRILLDALEGPLAYVPVDISADHLRAAAQAIQDDYQDLRVEAICADYSQPFDLPDHHVGRRVGFYPGSTIGNLTPPQAEAFLTGWAQRLGRGACMLVGVDLRKDATILEPAYDDPRGVTAAFSLNLLSRANRELGANFDTRRFRHEARYLSGEGRVAIHLRSLADQTVRIGPQDIVFNAGETIHIEDSWKYTVAGFRDLARRAGFEPAAVWTDSQSLFSIHLLDIASKGASRCRHTKCTAA